MDDLCGLGMEGSGTNGEAKGFVQAKEILTNFKKFQTVTSSYHFMP
jgi:hypothetical protein